MSRRSDALLGRVGHKDIVVIDHVDIDRATADALVKAGVTAVVNASPSISGRYPNLGPEILVASDIILVDGVGEKVFGQAQGRREDPASTAAPCTSATRPSRRAPSRPPSRSPI